MCDNDTFDAMHAAQVSRREVSKIGLGVSFQAALPRLANAAEVTESEVTIKTPDGHLRCALRVSGQRRARGGYWCGPDIFGLRPAFPRDGQAPGGSRLRRC